MQFNTIGGDAIQYANRKRSVSKSRAIEPMIRIVSLVAIFTCSTLHADPKLLIWGDSLSASYGIEEHQGWVTLLQERINSQNLQIDVINGSVSGETTTGGLSRLPSMLSANQPNWVLIELGGNDGLRGLPLSLMRTNFNSMIEMIKNTGAQTILAGMQIPPNYGRRYTEPFFSQYSELAAQHNLPLIPFLIDGIPQRPELMQDDGIHPRAEAQGIILENVWPVLFPLLGP